MNRPCGFTLVELLLALAISTCVLAAAVQTVLQTQLARGVLLDDILDHREIDAVIHRIRSDIDARLHEKKDALRLALDSHRRPVIEIRCLTEAADDTLHLPRLPAIVRYRTIATDTQNVFRLVREVEFLHEPSSTIRSETVCNNLTAFGISAFDGTRWSEMAEAVGMNDINGLRIDTHRQGADMTDQFTIALDEPREKDARP